MLITTTSGLVELITGSSGTIHVQSSYADQTTTAFTPISLNYTISSAGTTTIVGSPSGSTQRSVHSLKIRNAHATTSNECTVRNSDGATTAEVYKRTLLAGEEIQYDGKVFRVFSATGKEMVDSGATVSVPTGTGWRHVTSGVEDGAASTPTKSDVGLGSVDNTSDAAKPVSTATQTALDLKAPIASPVFTGTVTLPTGLNGVAHLAAGVVSGSNIVTADISDAQVTLAKMADLAQDLFIVRTTASTGVPQTATVTAAARTVLDDATVGAMLTTMGGATLASPTFTGVPAAPTAAADTSTTQLATTAFVMTQVATQAEQETGTSVLKFVTPGRQHNHPGHPKAWGRFNTAGAVTSSYNITSVADTGTGVIAVTLGTDFSSATGYACQVSVEATATTWAVANARECHIRSATLAAGTVSLDCIDKTTTTNLVKDPSSWHFLACGDQ